MKIDILNRTEFVDRAVSLVEILSEQKRGISFAIDGKWGSGKTFVLELLENKIKKIQSEESNDDRCFLVHYNCWQYDYYDEPSVAIVSAMKDAIEEHNRLLPADLNTTAQAVWRVIKEDIANIAGKFTENHIGVNIVDTFHRIKNEEGQIEDKRVEFDSMFTFKETIEQTRASLEKITKDKTMVIVVDELDRCMPSYGIKVLERLHHIFDGIDNVIVIIAVDSEQLDHSIKEIYGEATDVQNYLKKFIKFRLKLDVGSINGNIFDKYQSFFSLFDYEEDEKELIEEAFNAIWQDVDIRTQEAMIEKAMTLHNLVTTQRFKIGIALYEMMAIRFADVYMKNLSWIININRINYGGLNNKMSDSVIGLLKNLEKFATTGVERVYLDTSYELDQNPIGVAYYLIYKCYKSEYKYYMKGEAELKDLVNVAEKFTKLLDIFD